MTRPRLGGAEFASSFRCMSVAWESPSWTDCASLIHGCTITILQAPYAYGLEFFLAFWASSIAVRSTDTGSVNNINGMCFGS